MIRSLSAFPTGIALDRSKNVYVSGSNGFGTGNVWTAIKYFQSPTLGVRDVDSRPLAYSLEQNYPNPFNPSTTIRYGLPLRSHVTLAVFNTLGQQVALLQNGEQDAGYHEVQFNGSRLSSGAYFYQLRVGDLLQTRNLLLLK